MMNPPDRPLDGRAVSDLEIDLLLEGIWRRYGFDFRDYDRRIIRQRVRNRLREEGLRRTPQLLERILRRPASMDAFIDSGKGLWDGFFRPAQDWRVLRRRVVPVLRTYSSVRGWVVGNPSEADLYSLLLMFDEELARGFTLYATNAHDPRLCPPQPRSLGRQEIRDLARRYLRAGGRRSFSEFFRSYNGEALILPSLQRRIVFAPHNLATDASFNDFHIIVARSALRWFNLESRARTARLFHDSLVRFGFLMLGHGETLERWPHARCYQVVDRGSGLFQKMAD